METNIYRANKQGIKEAAFLIANNEVVAFPTETVYGLGANALSEEACKKIFIAKNRPVDNPLIVHISNIDQMKELVYEPSEWVKKIIEKFWPGPISIILNAKPCVPKIVTAGLNTVAVRYPNNDIALSLINESGCVIAAPSANISGKPSATKAEHVIRDFYGKISAVIEADTCEFGLESTVIDGTSYPIKILRPGAITYEMLSEICKVEIATNFNNKNVLSPGMKHPHYNPDANVILITGQTATIIKQKLIKLTNELSNYAVLGLVSVLTDIEIKGAIIIEKKENINSYAERLYSFFRDCDKQNIEHIILHEVDLKNMGLALMNRMNKAANQVL